MLFWITFINNLISIMISYKNLDIDIRYTSSFFGPAWLPPGMKQLFSINVLTFKASKKTVCNCKKGDYISNNLVYIIKDFLYLNPSKCKCQKIRCFLGTQLMNGLEQSATGMAGDNPTKNRNHLTYRHEILRRRCRRCLRINIRFVCEIQVGFHTFSPKCDYLREIRCLIHSFWWK